MCIVLLTDSCHGWLPPATLVAAYWALMIDIISDWLRPGLQRLTLAKLSFTNTANLLGVRGVAVSASEPFDCIRRKVAPQYPQPLASVSSDFE